MKTWKKLLVAALLIPLLAFIILEGLLLASHQKVEAKRRALVAAGGSTKTEKHVPAWLQSIKGDDFHTFLDEVVLTELEFKGPEIGDEQLQLVEGLDDLRNLDLSRSNVTSEGLKHLSGLKNLRMLNLLGTQVSDLTPLESLPHLEQLILEHSQVRDANLVSLSKWPDLFELNAGYLDLTDVGFGHIGGCTNLTILGLSGAEMTEQGFHDLSNLTELTTLVLLNAQYDPEHAKAFKQAVPGCSIVN